MQYAIAWLVAALVFLAADMIWLSQAVPRVYRPEIGHLLAPSLSLPAAAAFYLVYTLGIVVLAVAPALGNGGVLKAAALGLILGLVAYATYDLTNLATLERWSLKLTVIDMAWGALATSLAAAASFVVAARLK